MKYNFCVGSVELDCFGYEMSDEEMGLWRIGEDGEWFNMEDDLLLCEMEREVLSLR